MEFILGEIEKELSFTFPKEITVFTQGEDGIHIHYDGTALQVEYTHARDLFRAALLCKTHGFAAPFDCTEKSTMEDITFMADCSRGAVYTVDTVKKLLRNLAACGYTGLHLYIEDTYEIPSQPVFGYLRGRYTEAELRELDAYACAIGMELIPFIQTLAHLERLTKYPTFASLFDVENILMVGDERTYAFIEQMLASLRSCFTTKKIHIGMDEAVSLGLGRYLKEHGLRDRLDIFCEHLVRVCELAKKYDFAPNVASDMLFFFADPTLAAPGHYPKKIDFPARVLEALPENLSVSYWLYGYLYPEKYASDLRVHEQLGRPIWYLGCSWKYCNLLPSNYFSFATMRPALDACRQRGVTHIMNTAWGDDGAEAGLFSVLPSIVYFAAYANGYTDAQIYAQFSALSGYAMEDFLKLEYPDTYGKLCEKPCHTAKMYLYQDPLLGHFDAELDAEKYRESFAQNAALLHAVGRGQYAYLFDLAAALSEAVYEKYDLGLRAREAYQAGDRAALAAIPAALRTARDRVDGLYQALMTQWETEAKPQGFEVHDIRLGGLKQRLEHAACRIEGYLAGRYTRLEELEEKILPGAYVQTDSDGTIFTYELWNRLVSSSRI